MELDLPSKLRKALEREAKDARRTLHAHIVRKLEDVTPVIEFIKSEIISEGLPKLVAYLNRIPGVTVISSDATPDAFWWVKLAIDIEHHLAWSVVQELGFVLNYISLTEKLPTIFMPVSPPPYLNGGPSENLSWVIESKFNYIDPAWIGEVLEGRLPRPVEDETQWDQQEDDV
jgi:hypothetical protein